MCFSIVLTVLMASYCGGNSQAIVNRIIKGDKATENQFPYMVSLRHTKSKEHICGGAIIHQEWVLVTAHCIKQPFEIGENEYEVFVGSTVKHQGGYFYPVDKIIKHPLYVRGQTYFAHNLAVLKVKGLELSNQVATIPLGTINDADDTQVITVGWGRTVPNIVIKDDALKSLILDTMTTEQCQEKYRPVQYLVDGSTQICAYNKSGGSPCIGDFGGPLVNFKTKRLVGIFSNVENCRGQFPAIFVRVSAYLDWIQEATGVIFSLG